MAWRQALARPLRGWHPARVRFDQHEAATEADAKQLLHTVHDVRVEPMRGAEAASGPVEFACVVRCRPVQWRFTFPRT